MKGLLWKDFFNLKSVFRIYLAIPFFLAFLCYMNHSFEMMVMLPAICGIYLTISAYAYDEMNKFDTFALTTPLNRKDLVNSKYLFLILSIAGSMVVAMILAPLLVLIFGNETFPNFDYSSYLVELGVSAFAILALSAVLISLIIRYGTQNARVFLVFILIAIIFFGNMVVSAIMENVQMVSFLNNLEANVVIITLVCVAIALILLVISWNMSVHLMKKKEY